VTRDFSWFSQIEVANPIISQFKSRLFSSARQPNVKRLHELDVAFLRVAIYLLTLKDKT